LLQIVEKIIPAVGDGECQHVLAEYHAVRGVKINQWIVFVKGIGSVARAVSPIGYAEKHLREIVHPLGNCQRLLADLCQQLVDFGIRQMRDTNRFGEVLSGNHCQDDY
jgi:hypothetical protein